jgi:transcriptional regulator with XRE-family HTH domain
MLDFINPVYARADAEILAELGRMLKQKRIASNLTQSELAAATGISKDQISAIERTGKTTLATLVAISRKFGILQQLLAVYEIPELTPMQKYEIEHKIAKIKKERKRVKK